MKETCPEIGVATRLSFIRKRVMFLGVFWGFFIIFGFFGGFFSGLSYANTILIGIMQPVKRIQQIILNACFWKVGTLMWKRIPSTFATNCPPLIREILPMKDKPDARGTPRE